MSDGQTTMKLSLDFETSQAVAAAIALTQALQASVQAFHDLDSASIRAEASTEGFANAVDEATAAVKDSAAPLTAMAGAMKNVAEQAKDATQPITDVKAATKEAGDAANTASGQVGNWIAQYLTADAASAALDALKDRLAEISDAEQALFEKRSTELTSNKPIMVRYQVSQDQAESMVQEITAVAPVPREQARAAILAAGDSGLDPTKRGSVGDLFTKQLAKAGGVFDLDPTTLAKLARADVQRGGGTASSLDELVAKIMAAVPRGSNPNAVIEAAVSNVLPELARGENINDSLALYGAIYRQSPTAMAAATATRQLRQLADRGTKTSDAFFAAKAAETGVTKPATVDDAEAEHLIDEQTTRPEDHISAQRQALLDDQRKLQDDIIALQRRRNKLRLDRAMPSSRIVGLHTVQTEDAAIHADEEKLDSDRSRIERRKHEIDAAVAKFKADETTRRQQAAYGDLTSKERLSLVVIPAVRDAQTPEQRKALSDATSIRQGDAVFELGRNGGADLAKARASVEAAKGSDFGERVARFEGTDVASRVRTESQVAASLVNATDSGDTYTQNLMAKAVAQRQIQARQGGDGFDFSTWKKQAVSIATSRDRGVNENIAEQLSKDIAEMQSRKNFLTPQQQVGLDQIAQPFLKDRTSGVDLLTGAGLVTLQDSAEAFGAWKRQVDEEHARQVQAARTGSPLKSSQRNQSWKSSEGAPFTLMADVHPLVQGQPRHAMSPQLPPVPIHPTAGQPVSMAPVAASQDNEVNAALHRLSDLLPNPTQEQNLALEHFVNTHKRPARGDLVDIQRLYETLGHREQGPFPRYSWGIQPIQTQGPHSAYPPTSQPTTRPTWGDSTGPQSSAVDIHPSTPTTSPAQPGAQETQISPPASPPTTQPVDGSRAGGPSASAMEIHHHHHSPVVNHIINNNERHYHNNVGAIYGAGDDWPDLPGPLEQMDPSLFDGSNWSTG